MTSNQQPSQDQRSRRAFVRQASAMAFAPLVGLVGTAAAEPPPEISKIRLVKNPAICLALAYLAEEQLRLEGFSEVEYVELHQNTAPDLLMSNRADISIYVPPQLLPTCMPAGPS